MKGKMTIKEKVIRQAILGAEKEIKEIDQILNASPVGDIIRLERKAIETAKKMDAGSKEVLTYLALQTKKRDALLQLVEKQKDSISLIEKKVKISMELGELKGELWMITEREKGNR